MCANFQEATQPVCTLFSSSLSWYNPSHWYTRRTNTYCSKFLGCDIKVNTVYTLFMYYKDVCKFSRDHSTCMYFIFLIGLIQPIPLVHKAHKHVLQQVFGLRYQSKDCVYFVYVFQRCVQFFKRPLNLYVLYFPHHWAGTTHPIGTQGAQNTYCSKFLGYDIKVKTVYTLFMYSKDVCKFSRGHSTCMYFIFLIIGLVWPIPLVHKAHKHVLQQVFGLRYQSKHCIYFVYVFQRCVQIFKRPLNLCVVYVPHHWAGTTHLLGTQGAQTRIAASSWATISK